MGFSLGEIVMLLLVGIIVVGPKNLPGMMRTAGQWIARLRRMSTDLRSQSGIDDLLRQEGLEQHIHELRSLSRLNVVDSLMTPAMAPRPLDQPAPRAASPVSPGTTPHAGSAPDPLRAREYPLVGCDAYGALADDADGPPAPLVPADAPVLPAAADPYAPDEGPNDGVASDPKPRAPAEPEAAGAAPQVPS